MPVCLKCNGTFPSRMEIDGKQRILHKRKYCLQCKAFNTQRTKQIHIEDQDLICQYCKKNFNYIRGKNSHIKCQPCYKKDLREKRKTQLKEYAGNKCSICNYDRCFSALTFHHKNPDEKKFNIGNNYDRKWIDLKAEIDKCILVCHNCHSEIHAGLINISPTK